MKKTFIAVAILTVIAAMDGCGTTTDVKPCTPGASVGCVGPGMCAGGQVCNAAGNAFGPCECGTPSDSGAVDTGTDGSVDAPFDADTDSGSDGGVPTANQLLWLKADAIMGLTNSASVVTWPDSSSNKRDATQGNGSLRPSFTANAKNGLPAVHFYASPGSYLETMPFQLFATPSSPLTVFVVFRAANTGVQSIFFNQPQGTCNTPNFEFGHRTGANANANLGLHSGCYVADVTSTDISNNVWYVSVLQVLSTGTSPTNVKFRWNGVDQPVIKDNGGWVSAGGYGILSKHVVIGRRDDLANSGTYNGNYEGDIGEVIVYSVVDAMLLTTVETYLRAKWGI
jgi:hypothetical protein